jgi:predicted component of type VI protein secretion system
VDNTSNIIIVDDTEDVNSTINQCIELFDLRKELIELRKELGQKKALEPKKIIG